MANSATNALYGAVETIPESSGHVTVHSQLPESPVDDGARMGS